MLSVLAVGVCAAACDSEERLHREEGAVALVVVIVQLQILYRRVAKLPLAVENPLGDDFDVLVQGFSFDRRSFQGR